MTLLNRLTIKNLKLNKKRTIVTIIGIMLSVALITAVASMYASGIKSLIKYETIIKGDFHTAFYNVPTSDIDKFVNNRNIEKLNITEGLGYAKIDSKNEDKPYAYLKGFTKDALNNLSVRLVKGRLPENTNEIVIPTHLKTNGRLDLKLNDSITLEVGKRIDSKGSELSQSDKYQNTAGEQLVEMQTKTYKIVGIIERPATNIEYYTAPGYTFITYIDSKNLSGNVDIYAKFTKDGVKNWDKTIANILGVSQVLFRKVYNQEIESEKLTEQLKKTYMFDMNKYLIDLETNPISSTSMGDLGKVLAIVIVIIVFTSIFCIKNSFDISITEKIRQYGMLRSIGATKKQIKRNVFYEATILGLIGIPLGIILGCLATYILIIISNYYLTDVIQTGFKLELVFSTYAILVAIILGIITIYFSALKSATRASKVSEIDSIRNSANLKISSKKIKSPKYIKKLFGIGGVISFKNLKRNKKKYRTTIISITVSTFVFIALYSFMELAFQNVNNELKVSDFNISLSTNAINDYSYNKFLKTVNLSGVEDYAILRNSELSFTGSHSSKEYLEYFGTKKENDAEEDITIFAIGQKQYNKYIKSLGLKYDDIKDKVILFDKQYITSYDKNNNKIIKNIRVYDFNKGDVITSTNSQLNLEIGAISSIGPNLLKNLSNSYLIISDEMFDKIAKTNNLDIYYKASNADKLQDELDSYLNGESYNINNQEENVRIMNNLFTLIAIFLYGFIIVISLIGITNIFNTITTNMELRKQEFAMLKSIGMTSKEFKRMIRLESLFMGIKSLLFGILIGIILSYLIYLSSDSDIPYKLPIVAIIISILVVFILISLIMKYSLNKISKQNTIETIRNENI
ncbi:MAG: ABC transporter permease [Bacilli bacterium]|jgi:putative ABC transport system permease protein|nr:ABC transporter permease [Bacilli bacterium]